MATKKATKKASVAKKQPTTKEDYEKAGFKQVESGRWVKNVAEYNRKVKEGIIDPETGRRTGKRDKVAEERAKTKKPAAKATKKAAKPKAKARKAAKPKAEPAPAEAALA